MPFFKADIEQTASDRFLLEAEISFPICRHIQQVYPTLPAALAAAGAFHEDNTRPRKADPVPEPEPVKVPDPRDALAAEATALGIEIDGRWGEARLRQAVVDHHAARDEAPRNPANNPYVPRRFD